jgi:hypothetical protein
MAMDAGVSSDPAFAPLVAMHVVDMHATPARLPSLDESRHAFMPFFVGEDPAVWFARKEAARYGFYAPRDPRPYAGISGIRPSPPDLLSRFDGMSDSSSICPYYGGCQPPDLALAASSSWVVQSVNTSVAVYDANGTIQPGWPKTLQAMFNVPNPGSCDPNGPFLSNPRAFYDPADGRFWIAALQIEGAFGLNSCPLRSLYWVAVSKTGDPTGAWNVYAFNMRLASKNVAEFTQIGLDGQAFYFGSNMFDRNGTAFQYDEIFAANKASMEAGSPVAARGRKNIKYGSTLVDTLQPVLVEGTSPAAGLFVASYNIVSGGGNCVKGCSGINVFALANPLTAPNFTYRQARSPTYSLAPLADQPGCFACIETFDTRISGTPVYSGGLITFALETAVNNGTATVPGILWGQVSPKLSGSSIVAAKTYQDGLIAFAGDQAASFGAAMPDAADDLAVVFDTMGSSVNPGIMFGARSSTDPLGALDPPVTFKYGPTKTGDTMWGAYSATSYEGPATDQVWIAGEYCALGGDWATYIGALHF